MFTKIIIIVKALLSCRFDSMVYNPEFGLWYVQSIWPVFIDETTWCAENLVITLWYENLMPRLWELNQDTLFKNIERNSTPHFLSLYVWQVSRLANIVCDYSLQFCLVDRLVYLLVDLSVGWHVSTYNGSINFAFLSFKVNGNCPCLKALLTLPTAMQ